MDKIHLDRDYVEMQLSSFVDRLLALPEYEARSGILLDIWQCYHAGI